jgi:L-asparaginase/beta-aspartyl-peptidase (threonine type)
VTHCGAGSRKAHVDAAERAGAIALGVMAKGGTAVDAVEAAVMHLEDDPRLNAGTGSRLRLDGTIQMDAALMDHREDAGAVAAIQHVRHPIQVARRVMATPHILLVGEWATRFAREAGVPFYDPTTPETRKAWTRTLQRLKAGDVPAHARRWRSYRWSGTVGAVAVDRRGRMAAGSSTGGTTFMLPGRVGDTPIVGAGLYAGPAGAATATGVGEDIMRRTLSKHVYDLIADGLPPQEACERGVALFRRTVPVGVIAVSRQGWGKACNRGMAFWANAGKG